MHALHNGFSVCLRLWTYVAAGILMILLALAKIVDASLRLGAIPWDDVRACALFASTGNLVLWILSYMCLGTMSDPGITRRAHRTTGAVLVAAFIASYVAVIAGRT